MTKKGHLDELAARVRAADTRPHMILITETWLGQAIEEVPLEGYFLVSRRDRDTDSERGGVLVLVLQELADRVVALIQSATAERLWVVAHTSRGPLLVAVWYRPPCPGEVASVKKNWQNYGLRLWEPWCVGT